MLPRKHEQSETRLPGWVREKLPQRIFSGEKNERADGGASTAVESSRREYKMQQAHQVR